LGFRILEGNVYQEKNPFNTIFEKQFPLGKVNDNVRSLFFGKIN
jgi:hypothetical protein